MFTVVQVVFNVSINDLDAKIENFLNHFTTDVKNYRHAEGQE